MLTRVSGDTNETSFLFQRVGTTIQHISCSISKVPVSLMKFYRDDAHYNKTFIIYNSNNNSLSAFTSGKQQYPKRTSSHRSPGVLRWPFHSEQTPTCRWQHHASESFQNCSLFQYRCPEIGSWQKRKNSIKLTVQFFYSVPI